MPPDDNDNPGADTQQPAPPEIPDSFIASPAVPAWDRVDTLILLGVFALALLVRLIYVLQLRASPLFDWPIMDAAYHDEWAQAIAEGRPFVTGPYFRAPLYPWLLGAVYSLFGRGFLLPRLLQICLGAASCSLLYLLGRSTFGRTTGLLAAVAAATYWVFCYFEAELLIVPLIVFLDLLLLCLVMWAGHRTGLPRWLLAGVVLGLSAIARPNVLIFAPVVLVWLFLRWRRSATWSALGFVCGCLIPVLPITARNYFVGHDRVLISSQGGVNFFIGNNPHSDGVTAVVPGTPADWWGGYFESIRLAERACGRPLKPSEVSQFYFKQGLRFWVEQPGAAVALLLHKLKLFWTPRELGNNKDPQFFADKYTPIVRFLPLGFGLIAPLGLAGMLLHWRQGVRLLPLWGFVLVYMAGVVAFFVNSRFRVPVIPVLLLYSAVAVVWGVQRARAAEWSRLGGVLVVLAVMGLLYWRVTATGLAVSDAHSYQTLSMTLLERGQPEQAMAYARQWVQIDPANPTARVALARILDACGEKDAAISELRGVLRTDPMHPQALKLLTTFLAQTQRHAEAIGILRARYSANPHDMGIANLLAWFLVTSPQAELRNGMEAFQLAQAANATTQGRVVEVLDVLAATHAELGQFDEACRIAEEAIELAKTSRQTVLAQKIAARLARYRDYRPYRE
ncbi:MAG: glycosyltransferase family 39 protein [Planctomycetes bacterium]|nr:glycosyltransferase family 39 protein [Planctomycetota bacterium]